MSYIESLKKLLNGIVSPDVTKLVLEHLHLQRPSTFRLTSKCHTPMETLSNLGMDLGIEAQAFHSIPWFHSAFSMDNVQPKQHAIKNLAAVREGQVYFQSLSSMLPALCLDVQPGQNVLDLCAAPGSKTTLMNSMMKGQGTLVAVENDWVRMQRLIHNVRVTTPGLLGKADLTTSSSVDTQPTVIGNVALFQSDGRFFDPGEGQGQFDRVLVDAPCSGSGRASLSQLQDDAPTPVDWTPENIDRQVMRQKALLLNGVKMLRKGGLLIYSTCSLSLEENENVVQWLLSHKHELALMDLTLDRSFIVNAGVQEAKEGALGGVRRVEESGPLKLREALYLTPGPGYQLQGPPLQALPPPPAWAVMSGVQLQRHKGSAATDKMMRLLPCSQFEGFFMAKLIRKR